MITVIKVAGSENQSEIREFQISSSADLVNLPTSSRKSEDLDVFCSPGSIAYTAGFKQIWHLSDSDEWVEV